MNPSDPSHAKPAPPQLKEVLEKLPPLAKELLTRVWEYPQEHDGDWITSKDLFRNESDPNAKTVLKELIPSKVLTDEPAPGRHRYWVTLLGILLAENGEQDAGLLVQYLTYILNRHKEDPCVTRVTSSELRGALKIKDKKTEDKDIFRVGQMVYAGGFYHQGDSFLSPKMSRISLPDDIDELQGKELLAVVKARAISIAQDNINHILVKKDKRSWSSLNTLGGLAEKLNMSPATLSNRIKTYPRYQDAIKQDGRKYRIQNGQIYVLRERVRQASHKKGNIS